MSNFNGRRQGDLRSCVLSFEYSSIHFGHPTITAISVMVEDDLVPMALDEGVGIISYNPLAGGMLTGRYTKSSNIEEGTRFALGNHAGSLYQERYWQEATLNAVERYQAWCQERNYDPVTTAVHWVTQQSGITSAIIGASRPDQLDATLRSADLPDLTEQELAWLDGLWFSLPRRSEFR